MYIPDPPRKRYRPDPKKPTKYAVGTKWIYKRKEYKVESNEDGFINIFRCDSDVGVLWEDAEKELRPLPNAPTAPTDGALPWVPQEPPKKRRRAEESKAWVPPEPGEVPEATPGPPARAPPEPPEEFKVPA